MTKRPGAQAPGKSDPKGPAMNSAFTINNTPCHSHEPGHVLNPELLAATRANPAAWIPVLVGCAGPGEPIRIKTRTGLDLFRTHDALPLLELLSHTWRRQGKTIWNPDAGILGIIANPRIAAGYQYFSLTDGELSACALEHDMSLAARFESVTTAFDHPGYERNTGASA